MIEITNLADVNQQLDKWLAEVTEETTQVAKSIGGYALRWMAMHSPQFSGDFAANWKVKVNGIDTSFQENALGGRDGTPRMQGDWDAVGHAVLAGSVRFAAFKLGDRITISNSARHPVTIKSEDQMTIHYSGMDRYAWRIEDNKIKFREENHEGGRVRERFLEMFKAQYQKITKINIRPLLAEGRNAWT